MVNSNSRDSEEIQQGLLLMIHEYGIVTLLDEFSDLIQSGSLGPVENRKLLNVANYLMFASSEAAEIEPNCSPQSLSQPQSRS